MLGCLILVSLNNGRPLGTVMSELIMRWAVKVNIFDRIIHNLFISLSEFNFSSFLKSLFFISVKLINRFLGINLGHDSSPRGCWVGVSHSMSRVFKLDHSVVGWSLMLESGPSAGGLLVQEDVSIFINIIVVLIVDVNKFLVVTNVTICELFVVLVSNLRKLHGWSGGSGGVLDWSSLDVRVNLNPLSKSIVVASYKLVDISIVINNIIIGIVFILKLLIIVSVSVGDLV
mgnify:CR=1 FL=1